MSNEKLREAFELGWKMAANWSLSDHLLADIESPAYLTERDDLLQALATTEPVMENGLTEATKPNPRRIAQAIAPFFTPGIAGHDSTALDRAVSAVMDAIGSPSPSLPAVPEADVSFEDGKDQYGYPEYDHAFSLELIKIYGEQCWKSGYKHGALGGDARDAERYRWLADSNNYYEAINLISDGSLTEDALGKAIDAAMAKG